MNAKIGLLGGLAIAQVVLIAALFIVPGTQVDTDTSLLNLNPAEVTALVISDGDSEVQVNRHDQGWQVAGAPADADKIASILDKLANANAPWPVATSSSAAERFEVGADSYQRRVRLEGENGQLAELYLGTSPGYQRVHARQASSDNVYSVALSNYEFGIKIDDWLDKGLLASADTPTQITLELLGRDEPSQQMLVRGDEGWLFNGVAADTSVAQTYANRFTTLRVLGLVDEALEITEHARLSIVNNDNTTVFLISSVGDGTDRDYFIARRNGSEQAEVSYRLASYVAEQLLMTDANFAVEEPASP